MRNAWWLAALAAAAIACGPMAVPDGGDAAPDVNATSDVATVRDAVSNDAVAVDADDVVATSDGAVDASADVADASVPAGPYAALYVDRFDTILPDGTQRNALLAWAQRNGFNTLSLADLGTVLTTTSLRDLLPAFVHEAHVTYGLRVVAIAGRGPQFMTRMRAYDDARSDLTERFDGYNLEREWWNSDGTFADYTGDLMAMESAAHGSAPSHTGEEYVGWFTDPLGTATEAEIATALVAHSDRTLVHDYRRAPDLEYTRTRLEALARSAMGAGRTFDIVVIFSGEATSHGDPNDFMGEYFRASGGNHTFADAFAEYERQWNSTSFAGRSALHLAGYQVYAYSHAAWARP